MAQDIFLKLDKIDGESTDSTHKNEIEVLSWNWKVHQQANMHSGSGGGAGKASVQDLEFVHLVDRSSPTLVKHCLKGSSIDNAKLCVRKAGGDPLEYLVLDMKEVLITSVAPAAQIGDDARMRETVTLSFSSIKQTYTVQNEKGGQAGAVVTSYNVKENIVT